MQLIQETPELNSLFTKSKVTAACIGGGPGSDLLGILKFILRRRRDLKLTCFLFDKERAWSDSWTDVADNLNAPCRLNPLFNHLDVTQKSTWEAYQNYLRSDFITLSYFLSKVYQFKSAAEPFFLHMFANSSPGTIFLYIDNKWSELSAWFDQMTASCGLEAVRGGERRFVFAIEEEKQDLNPYFTKFGHSPKCQSQAEYRILRKP
jgi:hypothetical protein